MISIAFNIACIAAGILLALSILDKWDGDKDYFKKAAGFLLPYNTIIGGILLGLGIMRLLSFSCIIYHSVAVAGGLLLLIDILGKAPVIGSLLTKASKALVPFKVGIGLALFAIGLTSILGIHILC